MIEERLGHFIIVLLQEKGELLLDVHFSLEHTAIVGRMCLTGRQPFWRHFTVTWQKVGVETMPF